MPALGRCHRKLSQTKEIYEKVKSNRSSRNFAAMWSRIGCCGWHSVIDGERIPGTR
jgi:hypothetical protein